MNDVYLGDGVYLSHDGWQLWLAVNDHRNKIVALDSTVFNVLVEHGKRMFEEMKKTGAIDE